MDTEAFIRDPALGQRVVGQKLDAIVYPPEVNAQRNKHPEMASLHMSQDITDYELTGEV